MSDRVDLDSMAWLHQQRHRIINILLGFITVVGPFGLISVVQRVFQGNAAPASFVYLIAYAVVVVLFAVRRKKKFDGQLFWLYVLLYGITRSIIELFRGDFRGDPIFNILSISQATGIVMAVLAIIMLIYLGRKQPEG